MRNAECKMQNSDNTFYRECVTLRGAFTSQLRAMAGLHFNSAF
jgi:hypothetical protein